MEERQVGHPQQRIQTSTGEAGVTQMSRQPDLGPFGWGPECFLHRLPGSSSSWGATGRERGIGSGEPKTTQPASHFAEELTCLSITSALSDIIILEVVNLAFVCTWQLIKCFYKIHPQKNLMTKIWQVLFSQTEDWDLGRLSTLLSQGHTFSQCRNQDSRLQDPSSVS